MSEETDKIYDEASLKGLKLVRELLKEGPTSIAPSAITLGAAVGSLFGSMHNSPTEGGKENAKEWLGAFFLTMTGGLKKTMGINLSVQWTIKED